MTRCVQENKHQHAFLWKTVGCLHGMAAPPSLQGQSEVNKRREGRAAVLLASTFVARSPAPLPLARSP